MPTVAPSIAPEQLLKARVLMALYSVRSERLFCEQLAYNLLWLWFLDRELDEGAWDHSTFSQNQERVLCSEGAQLFFYEVFQLSRERTVDQRPAFQRRWNTDRVLGQPEEFCPQGRCRRDPASFLVGRRSGQSDLDFKGERRTNATHQSRTDPEAVLYRKGKGKEAKLYFGSRSDGQSSWAVRRDHHSQPDRAERKRGGG